MTRSIKPTEHQEQVAIFEYAKLKAGQDPRWIMLVAIPNAGGIGKDNIIRGKILKSEGMAKGFPDMLLAVPSGPWCGMFIELKRIGGKLSPEQRSWLIALEHYGYMAIKCEGAEQAIKAIEVYLELGE
jgi:hypothetical protein